MSYFYDKYGYKDYDVVCQFDLDHSPKRDYLSKILRAFSNPKIGYVACPSISSRGSSSSWYARGRLFSEKVTQGIAGCGYNDGYTPICVGSHYAVRTQALKKAGGIGPELAEDYTTSVVINQAGYDGHFELDAIAIGDGPRNCIDGVTQEFQWSRSLTVVLFKWHNMLFKKIPLKKRINLYFILIWYPLLALSIIPAMGLLIYSLATGVNIVSVEFVDFIWRLLILDFPVVTFVAYLKRRKLTRPYNIPITSWEEIIYNLTKVPWVILGIFYGIMDLFAKKPFKFKVTPKGDVTEVPLQLNAILPYLALSTLLSVSLLIFHKMITNVPGYAMITLITGIWYLCVCFLLVIQHANEKGLTKVVTLPTFISLFSGLILTIIATVITFKFI